MCWPPRRRSLRMCSRGCDRLTSARRPASPDCLEDREACADGEAQNDGVSGSAHGAFGRCQEGAQNECPGWPGSLDQVIDECLAQMFAEGPGPFAGHGHYLNMTAPGYASVACGFASAPDGKLWIVQNFYR